jgi:ParB family chromosome partitioning protein
MFGDAAEDAEQSGGVRSSEYRLIPIGEIKRNPFQPRTDFDEVALHELTESIRQHGVLQPLLVRPAAEGFQLIAGERRWLASQRAGLGEVPCRVREADDRQVTEAAIEENIKRADLNALEKAQAFKDYLDRFGCPIETLAQKLSMTRSNVSNLLRLLELPGPIQKAVEAEKLSYGHARALLPLKPEEQLEICQRIVKESLSVRRTEEVVREILRGEASVPFEKPAREKPEPSNHVRSLQEQLQAALGAKVEIKLSGPQSGKIVISFANNDEFERIVRACRPAPAA